MNLSPTFISQLYEMYKYFLMWFLGIPLGWMLREIYAKWFEEDPFKSIFEEEKEDNR